MVDRDRLLAVLSTKERRIVCRHLLSRDDAVAFEELCDAVVAVFDDIDREPSIDNGDSADARLALHHHHLPKLVEADVVEYDGDRGRVEPGPAFPSARAILEVLDEIDVG